MVFSWVINRYNPFLPPIARRPRSAWRHCYQTTALKLLVGITSGRGAKVKQSTNDQIAGKFHEVKGKVVEKTGKVTNNPKLQADGQAEKIAGKVQKKVGQVEKVFEG